MTKRGFELAVEIVLEREGVLSEHAWDDGGLTKYGISQKAFPDVDVANLTVDGAVALYRREFWDRCRCDAFDFPIALFLFDGAVNHGVAGVRIFQRAAKVREDGVVGPKTIVAVKRQEPRDFLATYLAYRICFIYVPHPDWLEARVGWMRRLFLNCLDLEDA